MRVLLSFSLLSYFLLKSIVGNAQYASEVIDYHTEIEVQKGKISVQKNYVIQVNSKSADWVSDVRIPFRDKNDLDILAAEVLDKNGNVIRKLKKKEITTRSDISNVSFFEDDYVKSFKLKWHQYPYRIHYQYRITYKDFLHITDWYPIIDTDFYTHSASLNIYLPSDLQLKIKNYGGMEGLKTVSENGIRYRWEMSDIQPIEKESYSPAWSEVLPHVFVTPLQFHYGVNGSTNSWEVFGNWAYFLNEGLLELPDEEKREVDRLIKDATSKKEKIQILHNYMQKNTRYINVAIDKGGLKSYPASYVSKNKYGDCKALTTYMKALLNHAGIESYYTKVNAGEEIEKIDESTPGQQFNHVILCVPIDGDTVWLENTSQCLPAGYMGTFTQNRKALVIQKDGSRLVDIPALTSEDVLNVSNYLIELGEDSTSLSISKILRGDNFETLRYYQTELDTKGQKDRLSRFIPIHSYSIEDWSLTYDDLNDTEVKLNIELKTDQIVRKLAGDLVVSFPQIDLPTLAETEGRNFPFRFSYPTNQVDSVKVSLEKLSDRNVIVPEEVTIESAFGSYTRNAEILEDEVVFTRKFQINSGNYPKESYKDFFSFYKAVELAERQAILIIKQRS